MASPGTFVRAAMTLPQLRPVRAGALAAAALPAGRVPTELISSGLRPLFRDGWPDPHLWVCALRLDTGRRTVFGREGAPAAAVADAVGASCAIPGFFEPVEVDGVRYVDGGAHSPTNAPGGDAARTRRRATPVLAFQPTAADLAVMGLNAMDPDRREPVTRRARESTRRRLARPDVRDHLELLRPARAASR
jgi:NTE family protein